LQSNQKKTNTRHAHIFINFFFQSKKAKFVFFQNWFWWKRFRRKNI